MGGFWKLLKGDGRSSTWKLKPTFWATRICKEKNFNSQCRVWPKIWPWHPDYYWFSSECGYRCHQRQRQSPQYNHLGQHITNNAPFLCGSLVIDQERMRLAGDFLSLESVHWASFSTFTLLGCWHEGHLVCIKNTCATYPQPFTPRTSEWRKQLKVEKQLTQEFAWKSVT